MKIDESKYEKAMDAAMIVASAKLFFFNKLWSEIKGKLDSKKVRPKRVEMIRRYFLNCVADLDEAYFFVPPEEITSEKKVQKYLERKYGTGREIERITRELIDCMTKKDPTLADYSFE